MNPAPPIDGQKVVRLVDELFQKAMELRASDIHLEPKEQRLHVRLRVDGVLVDATPYPVQVGVQILQRIKVLGNMDIAERRLPQDGVFQVRLPNGAPLSVRAASFPSVNGEKIVLRLLTGGRALRLDQLGLPPEGVEQLRVYARATSGLLLVTGPTGAGKTSPLYATLEAVDTLRRNVVTLEDPVEVQLAGITQGQVDKKVGFTFADGLRAALRQDPDVILVGEMRDAETASIAVQASLTGHLVLSTLHTNSAVESITRLLDLGVEPFVVANALLGVVSQRLLRRLCVSCSRPAMGPPLPELGPGAWRVAGSCDLCQRSGYRGRVGAFEVLAVDDELREMVKQKPTTRELREHIVAAGTPSLRQRATELAARGLTTWDEVLRVT